MSLSIDINIEAGAWDDLADAPALIEAALAAAATTARRRFAKNTEVSVLLTDDAAVRSLNHAWRAQDKPTNVLSFPARPIAGQPPHLGDIALAYETTMREAKSEGKSPGDHVSHLAVHGFLHLLGYDHETPDEAEAMEALERAALARLGIADPYEGSEPAATGHAP
ncbi:MAG: rRNA maturation RNase YbeY [Hyphomicrobiales bacterium]|nr:rRNA maturation RNase YbeY [Hyphomicrobiales bacterium]